MPSRPFDDPPVPGPPRLRPLAPRLRLPDGSSASVSEHALVRLEQRFAAHTAGRAEVLERVQRLLDQSGRMSTEQPGWRPGRGREGQRFVLVGDDLLLIVRGSAVVTGVPRSGLADQARPRRDEDAAADRRSWGTRPRHREGRRHRSLPDDGR